MSMLKFTTFGGEVPRLTKRNLPDNAAQEAYNLLADTPEFRPLPADTGAVDIALMAGGATCKTLYRYPSTTETPMGSALALKLERSPIVADQYDRVYVSTMKGETEMAPRVMTAGSTNPGSPGLPFLGVKYPTAKLTLTALDGETLLTAGKVETGKDGLLADIRTILQDAVEEVWWNPSFDASPLTAARGFREAENGGGLWQRVFGVVAPTAQSNITPGTWVTFNGSDLERHMWVTEVQNPPYKHYGYSDPDWMEGSGTANRAYYANFQAKTKLYKLKSDGALNVTGGVRDKLKALLITGTTTRLLSDDEITGLFGVLRHWLPADPMAIPSADAQALLSRFRAAYDGIVPKLENGFDTTEAPAMALQKLSELEGELRSTHMAIAQALTNFATTEFDAAVIAYMQETRFDGKFPEGETPVIEPRFYTYTFVNERGEESKPYLPGDGNIDTEFQVIEVNQKQGVTVTRPAVDAGVITLHKLTKWRIYRAANGSETSAMLFAAELPIATTVYPDALKTEQLNEPLATSSWFPPPVYSSGSDAEAVQNFDATGANTYRYLKGIVAMPGGFMAGYLDNTVYFSEVYHAYAWPPEFAIPVQDDIRALGVFGNTLVVLTNGRVSFISGAAPDAMQKIDIETVESCASARSVVPVSGGVIFASHNGLCLASQQGVQNLTPQLFTRDEWLAIDPYSLICEEMDGVVYFTQDNGVKFMGALHVPSGKLVRVDQHVTAMYSDYLNGRLYVAYPPVGGAVPKAYALMAHPDNYRTARWKSKRIVLEKQTGFAWLAVEGEQTSGNPLNVNIWGFLEDGTQVKLTTATGTGTYSAVVTNTKPVRVEAGRFKDFEVEIRGQCRVSSVLLASSTAELQGVN